MADTTLQSWEYLETLPGTHFYRLYRSPASALAIFRKRLSSLAKTFVMMLLYMPLPVPAKQLEVYVKDSSRGEREYALDLLHRYHIVRDVTFNSSRAYALTPDFAKSLRRALTGAASATSFGQVYTVPPNRQVTVPELDEYSRQRWEGILGYMVGSRAIPMDSESAAIEPSPAVIELLKAGHLIEVSGTYSRGTAAKITKEGFAFVLQDINTQIWALLFLYVDNAEALGMDKVDVLSFLFLISSLELGLAYSTSSLDETQRRCLSDLVSIGIIYQPPSSSPDSTPPYFYPTRLATTLLSSDAATASLNSSLSSGANQGFIILETNYRLYAYTSSPIVTALLSLFTSLRTRHPNLITGKISKSSIQRAVNLGITSAQILAYLAAHAHPQMLRRAATKNDPNSARPFGILPPTVVDQIHLWQMEKDRLTTHVGFLMKDFANEREYKDLVRYSDETGVLVYRNDAKRVFFVSRIEGVRAWLADKKTTQGSGPSTSRG